MGRLSGTKGGGSTRPGDPATAAFAHRLRELMDERGWSLHETARRVQAHLPEGESISRASISRYRTGRAVPRLRHLHALSLALGVPKSELISFWDKDQAAGASAHDQPSPVPLPHPAAAEPGPADAARQEVGTPEGFVQFVDLGDKMHLVVDQVVPWPTGLKILKLLRGSSPEAEQEE
ncbi:MAG TPA: helix-turn-helix transcriptional regulator [Microvirga sp.]|nr:helix-turn-helix transcriptional regulator [Microvirga sp.]